MCAFSEIKRLKNGGFLQNKIVKCFYTENQA